MLGIPQLLFYLEQLEPQERLEQQARKAILVEQQAQLELLA
jgi:hypothetical protein